MRRFMLLVVLSVVIPRAFAARVVTLAQLEQILTSSARKTDADLARQIAELQLSERLSRAQLERLRAAVSGERTRQLLVALAGISAFQPLPSSGIPNTPPPNLAEQRRIMGLVAGYVSKTIPQLPNFLATRVTTRFEDTPLLPESVRGFIPYEPMHYLDTSSETVLYRNGRELVDSGGVRKTTLTMTTGLTTWGVFGPILGAVLVDAAKSKLAWSHWEQGPDTIEAVFSYAVPKEKSHYEVNYCCIAEEAATASANVHPFRRIAGYHGEMSVDPATGTVLRLTVQAEMKPDEPVAKASIMVEYGPVEIGGKRYFCPLRSVSSTLAQTLQLDLVYKFPLAHQLQPQKNSVNDVRFEQYHVFRAESRVLGEAEAKSAVNDSASSDSISNAMNTVPLAADQQQPADASFTELEGVSTPANPAEAPVANNSVAPPPSSQESRAPEISVTAASSLPEVVSIPTPSSQESAFTLRSTTRLVDLSVVAFDKKGHPVTDLKPHDFEIYDNGVAQKVRFFSQSSADAAQVPVPEHESTPQEGAQQVYSNKRTPDPSATPRAAEPESGITVLMIDSSNLAWGDMQYARAEMLRFLKSVPGSERVGLYILKSHSFQIVLEPTVEHTQIESKLTQWMPSAQDLAHAEDEEQRNRQQFDWLHKGSDLAYVNGNSSMSPESFERSSGGQPGEQLKNPVDAELRDLGSSPERDSLNLLVRVARHLATLPGHKSLVWVASDNVLADWSNQNLRSEKSGKFLDPLFLHAEEGLNEAHVSIYPLDASQLEAGGIGSDVRNRNVNVVGYTPRSQITEGGGPMSGFTPGRDIARMQQDTHPIQEVFRELAEATGGRALRRAGDIAAELHSIVADGRAVYQFSFTPNIPADDTYHHLSVKVPARKDITLRYRTGYMYSEEPATMKARFQQAIWQPSDSGEIGITAALQASSNSSILKLNIAAVDLALKQEEGFWTDTVDVFLVVRDDAMLRSNLTGKRLGLRLKPGTYQRILHDGTDFEESVDLKPLEGSARIIVVDENSGRIGTITIPSEALRH